MILSQPLQRTRVYLEHLWGLISMVYVIGLVAICGYWALDISDTQHFENSRLYLSVRAGDTTEITSNVVIATSSTQVAYTLNLVDAGGTVVHVWPMLKSRSDVRFKQSVKVPTEVPKGEYRVMAEIQYPQNPILTRMVEVELARLVIN